jgi:response regulator RpfG family c-di-GMP phosphodiesterase
VTWEPLLSVPVLVLDAADGIGQWMRDALLDAGLACTLARGGDEADRSLDAQRPALVAVLVEQVEAWTSVLRRVGEMTPRVPVLGVVGRDAPIDFTPALALGVTDLLTYPCSAEDLVIRVASSMRGRHDPQRVPERVEPASPLATLRSVTEAAEEALLRTETAAARVNRSEEREHLRSARESLAHSLQVILGTMIGTAEASGHGREGHARLAAALTRKLTTELGWSPPRVRGMELAAMFCDIGLLDVPGEALAAPGPLDPAAAKLLRRHPDVAADILEPLSRVGVPIAAVRAHHERLDGSGYPRALRGRQVPLGAQVLAVVDTYAALIRPRPHRPALDTEAALVVLEEEAAAGRLAGKLVDLLREVVARDAVPAAAPGDRDGGNGSGAGGGNGGVRLPRGAAATRRAARSGLTLSV